MLNREALLETTAHRGMIIHLVGVVAAVGLIGVISFGVLLFMGLSDGFHRLPDGFEVVMVVSAVGGFGLCALAFAMHVRSRIPVAFVRSDGEYFLEIDDPRGPIVLAAPFDVRFGWRTVYQPKGPNMTMVLVAFFVEGEHVVTITETWGALYGVPHGWPAEVVFEGGGPVYSAGGRRFLVPLIDSIVP